MELFEHVGRRIRELREAQGLSQEALAKLLDVAANTVSRWETVTNKPDLSDRDERARVLNVSILEFLPGDESAPDEPLNALLRTAKQLPTEDLQELRRYAEYRRARHALSKNPRSKPGRKRKDKTT